MRLEGGAIIGQVDPGYEYPAGLGVNHPTTHQDRFP